MTKKSTKKALVLSVLSLVVCITMLVGTTFAWFTDSVTSTNNIIKSGNLDVEMYWAKGTEDPGAAKWEDASKVAIFDYDNWEPGYTEVRHVKIKNAGSLALKYQVAIVANGEVSELADVIDVYYLDPAAKVTERTGLAEANKLGVLTKVLAGMDTTAAGELLAGKEDVVTIALKMQESAGNEYQGLEIGSTFSVVLYATQLASEYDSFDNTYDKNAPAMYTVNGVQYDTAEAALAAAKDGDKVYLSSVNAPIAVDKAISLTIANANIAAADGENGITVKADATVAFEGLNYVTGGANADGIYVAENVKFTLTGSGILVAKGNAATDDTYSQNYGGSGIYGAAGSTITLDGANAVTAEGYGKHAFGIGGATSAITINNSTVSYAKGGMVQPLYENDLKWGKYEPEAGAAIGSNTDGAVITITGSTVKKAEGGSKAAGIGAMYHTGVTVNITDSSVTAYGGNASAGIGGSRVTKHESAESQAIAINIKNSTVAAYGGQHGAGIGSGYNTYTSDIIVTDVINIDAASVITAKGGLYAAGVGTGYNNAGLEYSVLCDTANIKADKTVKDGYTLANDIGLGALKVESFSKVYNFVSTADELISLGNKSATGTVILTADIDMGGKDIAAIGAAYGKELTVFGNGHKISNAVVTAGGHNGMDNYGLFYAYTDSTLTINDLVVEDVDVKATGANYGAAVLIGYMDGGSKVTMNNVVVKNSSVENDYDEAAVFVGYQTGTLVLNNCSSTGCSVKGETDIKTGAFIGHCNGVSATLNGCTTDLTIGVCNRSNGTLTVNN